MSDKVCKVDGCDFKLRSNNTTGFCPTHKGRVKADRKRGGDAGDVVDRLELGAVKPPPKRKAAGDAVKRMKVVADALGLDGDQLLEEYAAAWLAALQVKANEP